MENGNRGIHANRFLPFSVDHFGRPIGPAVYRIAQEIAPQAVSYGERVLGDSAVAMTLFEEVAATVSRSLKADTNSGLRRVRAMRQYLFRAYLRRIGTARRTEPHLLFGSELLRDRSPLRAEVGQIETAVVLREIQDCCDDITRAILRRRLEGCSWKQIEREFGISANAATLRLRRAVRNLRPDSADVATSPATSFFVDGSVPLPRATRRRLMRAS